MRYLDWDVLVFPQGEGEGVHIPCKEFKTQCQAEHKARDAEPSALMTCFVPSMTAGTSFQISVHSWTNTRPIFAPSADGFQPRELWEVRVVVDGRVDTVAHLPVDAPWPQIISSITHEDGLEIEKQKPLAFPPFHNELRNERSWSASDELGRIRVELSAGLWDEKANGYAKLTNIVSFAFQHAPLRVLELAGIAWPSMEMYRNPLPRQSGMTQPQVGHSIQSPRIGHSIQNDAVHHAPYMVHRKMPSVGNLQLPGVGGLQALAAPASPYQNYANVNNFDANSRSTSAYSTLSASAGPIMPNNNGMAMPQQQNGTGILQQHNGGHSSSPRDAPHQFRLPSDQLAQLIAAIRPQMQEQQAQQVMPPPPLPAHKNESTPMDRYAALASTNQRTEIDQHAINLFDRRAASNSNFSDVSMHAGCNNFPHCISEDPNGCLVHDGTGAPAPVVKGKKEGSSTKPRDFFSVTLDAPATSVNQVHHRSLQPPMTIAPKDMMNLSPVKDVNSSSLVSSSPADATGKKRTRSALKALNINDGGSPQKADANKPVRKASRASVSSIKSGATEKENVSDQLLAEDLENQESMLLDA